MLKEWEEYEKPSCSFFGGFHFSSPFHSPRKENRSFQYDAEYGRIKSEYEEACDLLGVSTKESLDEVRKRFHTLALQYHPDKNPGSSRSTGWRCCTTRTRTPERRRRIASSSCAKPTSPFSNIAQLFVTNTRGKSD